MILLYLQVEINLLILHLGFNGRYLGFAVHHFTEVTQGVETYQPTGYYSIHIFVSHGLSGTNPEISSHTFHCSARVLLLKSLDSLQYTDE